MKNILRAEGFYWIKRTEPDGPSEWEPAKYRHHHYEAGVWTPDAGRYVSADLGPCWYVIGTDRPQREVTTVGASNRWEIGEVIVRTL